MIKTRFDIYALITNRIIADLELGRCPWHRPWSDEDAADKISCPLRHNGVPYRSINVITLWSASVARGYSCPLWLTFKQAQNLGGNVRKGEHGEFVVQASRFTRTEIGKNGRETNRENLLLRSYTVFNAEQCDGLPAQYYAKPEVRALPLSTVIEAADSFFAATGVNIRRGGARACYAEDPDYVQMPPCEMFADAMSHSATVAHELIRWTKHPMRLGRDMGRVRLVHERYIREELVAEIGAAFLCANLNITPMIGVEHATSVAEWLTVMKGDKRFIFAAAAHAQRAVDYLHGLQDDETNEQERVAA